MDIRLFAAASLCIIWVAAVRAQSAPVAPDNAAMERAQREADGPRRRILEAAKAKGGVRPEAPAVPVAAPAPAAPTPVAAAVRRDEPLERTSVLATLPAALAPVEMPASSLAAVPTVSRVDLVPDTALLMAVPTTTVMTLPPPRLLSKVEPELPPRLQRRGARRTEVLVELTIGPDGSVREVTLRNSADEELANSVREALQKWRYEPQPVARTHTVQLVFGAS